MLYCVSLYKYIYTYIYIYIAMYNRTSYAQMNETPWGHWRIGNNREGTLSVFLTTYILHITLILLLWDVSTGTSNQIFYAPCLTCWALFGSLVPAMCNRASCAQVHDLPWGHWQIGKNREGTLFVFLTIYI